MVDRQECEYASDWFFIHFLKKTKPLGSRINNMLSEIELESNRMKSNTLAGFIFTHIDKGFTQEKRDIAFYNFGDYPENLMNKFNEDLHKNFRGATKGPALARIAPYLLINQDVADVIFDFTQNECIEDIKDVTIPTGCLLLYFDYGHDSGKMRLEMDPYINKLDRYIIVNGNEFANVLNISVDFLKSRALSSVVPNSSIIIAKIIQNPSTFVDADPITKQWLFKTPSSYNYVLKRGQHITL